MVDLQIPGGRRRRLRPTPIPIVRDGERWYFESSVRGHDEIIDRRIRCELEFMR